MPRNSGGTYSLPAGNPVISGTTITSTWANTTLNDIATAMTDSLARDGKGAMLAALQLFDGTSSAPGLTFGSEQSSGIYRKASHDFCFQVNSNTVQEWTATGIVITGNIASIGPPNGNGADFAGGTGNTVGCAGTGVGSGSGLYGTGGATGPGVTAVSVGTGPGLECGAGHAHFSGGNPAANTSFANTQTPVNMVKAQFHILLNGTAAPTLSSGFNVAASNPVTVSSSILTCNYHASSPMLAATYVAQVTLDDFGTTTLYNGRINVTATGSVSVVIRDNSGVLKDPAAPGLSGQIVHVSVFGAQ